MILRLIQSLFKCTITRGQSMIALHSVLFRGSIPNRDSLSPGLCAPAYNRHPPRSKRPTHFPTSPFRTPVLANFISDLLPSLFPPYFQILGDVVSLRGPARVLHLRIQTNLDGTWMSCHKASAAITGETGLAGLCRRTLRSRSRMITRNICVSKREFEGFPEPTRRQTV